MTCTNCGASLESTATTCPVCGSPVGGSPVGGSPVGGDPGGPTSRPPGDPATRPAWETHDETGPAAGAGGAWQGTEHDAGAGGAWQGAPHGQGASWQTAAPHPSGLPNDVRGWGIGAHAASYLAFIGLPIVGPLLVWLIQRDHPFVDHHGKESLNFNLSVALYGLVLALLAIPVGIVTIGFGLIPLGALGVVLMLVWLVLPIVGCVKASNGEGYRYPMTIRFVR